MDVRVNPGGRNLLRGDPKYDYDEEALNGMQIVQNYVLSPDALSGKLKPADFIARTDHPYVKNANPAGLQRWVDFYRNGGAAPVQFNTPVPVQKPMAAKVVQRIVPKESWGHAAAGALADTFTGLNEGWANTQNDIIGLATKATDALGLTENMHQDIKRYEQEVIDPQNRGEYVHPDGWSRTIGKFGGEATALAPLAEVKLLSGASKAIKYGNYALQGALGGTIASGGDDVARNAAIGAVAAPALGATLDKLVEKFGPTVAKWLTSKSQQELQQLAERGLTQADLPAGVSVDDASAALASFAQEPPRSLGDLPNANRGEVLRVAADQVPGDLPPPPPGFKLDSPRTMAMDAAPEAAVTRKADYLFSERPRPLQSPVTDAQVRAADIQPGDVVPVPSNEVGSLSEAVAKDKGRFSVATVPNENSLLSQRTVKAWNGAEVPKRGPLDLVGWLRTQGGLKDQGGELSHMGLNNAPRKMDFAGQEHRFGPLVNNDSGMTLDDAAMRAWEQGYFPDHMDRPDVNEFLDAVRATHEGRARNFLPEDLGEVDAFHAAQQERYALQEQRFETGDKVYRDNSVPADEGQPFAPPEAYHEWGGKGPSRAGNIDLDKLDSPQSINRALAAVNERVGGFDEATRGRITNAETEALAGELGMTPDSLLARRKGQAFSAEEALAARQILAKSGNELVNAAKKIKALENPGDELLVDFQRKLARHVAIQEQVSGMTAEAGRTLQQFRMVADSRNVRGEVLAALVGRGGGADRIKDAAEVLLDAVETSPGQFNTIAEKAIKPKFRDKLVELYINSLLSGPQTHVVNMTSNTLTALGQIPEHALAAGIGGLRRLAGRGEDAITGTEVGARAFGLLQGVKEGAAFFARSLKTGDPVDVITKLEVAGHKNISGLKGEVIRLPTRFLTAEDELFKGIARRMEINGEAVRIAKREGLKGAAARARIAELSANPTDEMLARSMDYARYLTFQRKLGPFATDVANASNRHLLFKYLLPFVRTPTNLLKFAVERSPAAPLLGEWRAEFLAGGAKRDLAVARMMLGTGFGMAIYEAALSGKITGSAPSDPAKAKLLYADGWQPYSIKIGDTYYSYKRLDPLSTTIGVAADLALLGDGMSERQREEKATLLVASIMGNLAEKTWFMGLANVIEAVRAPERNAGAFVERLAGSVVPTGVAQLARTMDPVQRETDGPGDYIKSRIPGLSETLLPRRDIWGQPVTKEGGLGPNLISPIWTSTAKNDPVNRDLLAAEASIGVPRKKVGGRDLTPEEYDSYRATAGQLGKRALDALVQSPAWKGMDAEAREKAAEKTMNAMRKEARSGLFGGPAPKGKSGAMPPPPAGFTVEGQAGGVNVYADLQKQIPGIRFTSGFRTREYQADMKRRGYRPADDSGHLDGSSLDLLPPPGKSPSWLRGRVRQLHPDAYLLNEGDHLHATFPGYYGAPPLGGAKGKLSNPNAGMPPPPVGFKLD